MCIRDRYTITSGNDGPTGTGERGNKILSGKTWGNDYAFECNIRLNDSSMQGADKVITGIRFSNAQNNHTGYHGRIDVYKYISV